MTSINYVFLVLLPLIAFSIIFSQYYSQIDFIANKREEKSDNAEEIILDNGIGYPYDNDFIKDCKKENNDLINTDLLSLTIPKDEQILQYELNNNLPGTQVSIHPSTLSGGSDGINSWIMTRPPHLVSTGQGQGY